jgi:hypothetical protein
LVAFCGFVPTPVRIAKAGFEEDAPLLAWFFKVRIALPLKEQFMDFPSTTSRSRGEREDQFTSSIESQTSQIPSTGYLGAAIASMAGSAVLKIMGKDNWALFVGQWAPAFLIMGVYNKMVKQHGSDAYSRAA